jgi:hypothetical protein
MTFVIGVNGDFRVFEIFSRAAVRGPGVPSPGPNSPFLASADHCISLTFHRRPREVIVDLKTLDGTILDRTRYSGRERPQ